MSARSAARSFGDETLAADSTSPTRGPSDITDPAKIGRYVVLERLGEGGMGIVLAAYDPKLDRKIAIKLMRIQSASPLWSCPA